MLYSCTHMAAVGVKGLVVHSQCGLDDGDLVCVILLISAAIDVPVVVVEAGFTLRTCCCSVTGSSVHGTKT